jgi:hypothetical protein
MRSHLSYLAIALLGCVVASPTTARAQSLECLLHAVGDAYCVGDCDRNGAVDVTEAVRGVRIALAESAIGECRPLDMNQDGMATIDELVRTTDAAINGCSLPAPLFDQRLRLRLSAGAEAADAVRLTLETEQLFPCFGYRIATAIRIADGTIVVVLGCVFFPAEICLEVVSEAHFDTDLDLVPGTYTLELRAQGATDRYRVDLSPGGVEVNVIDASFSDLF